MKISILIALFSLIVSVFTADLARASDAIIKLNVKLTRTDVLGKTKSMAAIRTFVEYEESTDPSKSTCTYQIGRYDVLSGLTDPTEHPCFKVPAQISNSILISDDTLKEIVSRSMMFSLFMSDETFDKMYQMMNENHFTKVTKDSSITERMIKNIIARVSSALSGNSHSISLTSPTVFDLTNGQEHIRLMITPDRIVNSR